MLLVTENVYTKTEESLMGKLSKILTIKYKPCGCHPM